MCQKIAENLKGSKDFLVRLFMVLSARYRLRIFFVQRSSVYAIAENFLVYTKSIIKIFIRS